MIPGRNRRAVFREEALPHREALYRAALGMMRNPTVAEDLVQETYQEAWKSFHGYQAGSDCKAWLFRILFRIRSKHLRKQGRFQWVEVEDVSEERLAVEPAGTRQLENQEILSIIQSLPEHYRTVLLLADAEGFTYQEIAHITELPLGTVMSRLNRGRNMFRKKFLQACRDDDRAGGAG
ncbi:MAG TPA: sigma-70 family RNA polymerase sigma factor [Acidobacteriota bacterium]|nr:sigma-70 family RNA polymerase sigma factor [Acidobacteriota bacterium]